MQSAPPASVATLAPAIEADVVIEDDRWRTALDGALAGHDAPAWETLIAATLDAVVLARPHGLTGPAELTLLLGDDARAAALNMTFRGKAGATNVLSFPAAPGTGATGEPRYLGDILIAWETVVGEAHSQAVPLADHVQHLIVHGTLHLLGYDHDTDTDAAVMETLETRVLATLGVADPYAEPAAPPGP